MGQEQKEYTWQLVAKMLAGEASEQELEELGHLLRNNPELHYPLQTITGLWRHSDPDEQKRAEEAFSRHLDRMAALTVDYGASDTPKAMPSKKNRRLITLIGSALAAAAVTGLFLYRSPAVSRKISTAPVQVSEVATRNGTRTNLYLPDGTRVWLNAGSRITYNKDFGTANNANNGAGSNNRAGSSAGREVNLTGEAFFDVAHNPSMPFIIHTKRIDIKVLGTSFNVKSYPSDKTTETILIHGSIEVAIRNKANKKIILRPNEKLVVDNEDSTIVQRHINMHPATNAAEHPPVIIQKPTYEHTTGTMVETSWVNDRLIFQEEGFGELAKQMERWYGVTINFARPELQTLQFTGSFRQETIQQALDALTLTAAFNYTISGTQINIYEK
jgi:transmembrane sensor